MRHLLCLMLLILTLPAFGASLLESRPAPTLGGAALDNSKEFLPVRQAFQLSLIETTPQSIKLRLVATEGYYLYRHRFQFRTEPADIGLGEAQLPKGEQKHGEYFGDVEVYTAFWTSICRASPAKIDLLPLQSLIRAVPTRACAIRPRPNGWTSVM